MFAAFTTLSILIFSAATINRLERQQLPPSPKTSKRLHKLWMDVQNSMHAKKYLNAERALLSILKFDKKNTSAYNKLGMLYARQKEYDDAIDCFEAASSIETSPPTLHNLGLIYFETENYENAEAAFKKAIELDDANAQRHIALAKVLERRKKYKEVVTSLQRAYEIEPAPAVKKMLDDALVMAGRPEEAGINLLS